MPLLKESLRGKSHKAIKGIQLISQNYEWMIDTLNKKYENKPANRSRTVQIFRDVRPADKRVESNELVFDRINTLLKMRERQDTSIKELLEMVEAEIASKSYAQSRTRPPQISKKDYERPSDSEKGVSCVKKMYTMGGSAARR